MFGWNVFLCFIFLLFFLFVLDLDNLYGTNYRLRKWVWFFVLEIFSFLALGLSSWYVLLGLCVIGKSWWWFFSSLLPILIFGDYFVKVIWSFLTFPLLTIFLFLWSPSCVLFLLSVDVKWGNPSNVVLLLFKCNRNPVVAELLISPKNILPWKPKVSILPNKLRILDCWSWCKMLNPWLYFCWNVLLWLVILFSQLLWIGNVCVGRTIWCYFGYKLAYGLLSIVWPYRLAYVLLCIIRNIIWFWLYCVSHCTFYYFWNILFVSCTYYR